MHIRQTQKLVCGFRWSMTHLPNSVRDVAAKRPSAENQRLAVAAMLGRRWLSGRPHSKQSRAPRHGASALAGLVRFRSWSFAGVRLHGLLDLLLDGFQVEARALLHRRELDRGLSELPHLLLHQHEAPELVDKVVVERERT